MGCGTSNLSVLEPLPSAPPPSALMSPTGQRPSFSQDPASSRTRSGSGHGWLGLTPTTILKASAAEKAAQAARGSHEHWEEGAAEAFEKLAVDFGRREVSVEFVALVSEMMRERHLPGTPHLASTPPQLKVKSMTKAAAQAAQAHILRDTDPFATATASDQQQDSQPLSSPPTKPNYPSSNNTTPQKQQQQSSSSSSSSQHNTQQSLQRSNSGTSKAIILKPVLESPTDTTVRGAWGAGLSKATFDDMLLAAHTPPASAKGESEDGGSVRLTPRQRSEESLSVAETNSKTSTSVLHVDDMAQVMGTTTSLLHRIGGTIVMESIIELALHKMQTDDVLCAHVHVEENMADARMLRKALMPMVTGTPIGLSKLPSDSFLSNPKLLPSILRILGDAARELDTESAEVDELLSIIRQVCEDTSARGPEPIEEDRNSESWGSPHSVGDDDEEH